MGWPCDNDDADDITHFPSSRDHHKTSTYRHAPKVYDSVMVSLSQYLPCVPLYVCISSVAPSFSIRIISGDGFWPLRYTRVTHIAKKRIYQNRSTPNTGAWNPVTVLRRAYASGRRRRRWNELSFRPMRSAFQIFDWKLWTRATAACRNASHATKLPFFLFEFGFCSVLLVKRRILCDATKLLCSEQPKARTTSTEEEGTVAMNWMNYMRA